ncbi:hypothetical protein [Alicyclobacillus suci]|uniref:hypothetical protein n=1 Tax=Alicyclobacillus suci TaxID=2816080 RepID=UPI001A8F51A8|nr:hypothetical protein [Alicyclobacillus suci]
MRQLFGVTAGGTFVARYVGFQSGHVVVHTAVFWTEVGKTSVFAEPEDTIDFAVSDYWSTPVAWLDADSGFTIRDSRLLVTHDAGTSWVWIPSRHGGRGDNVGVALELTNGFSGCELVV